MDLSTKQLAEALQIRKAIDELEAQRDRLTVKLNALLGSPSKSVSKKARGSRRQKPGPKAGGARPGSQKYLVREILREAHAPLSSDQILSQLAKKGFKSKSSNPKRTLSVILYTDPVIGKAGRGLFVSKEAAASAPAATKKAATKKATKPKRRKSSKKAAAAKKGKAKKSA